MWQYKKVGGTRKFGPVSQFGDFPSICIFLLLNEKKIIINNNNNNNNTVDLYSAKIIKYSKALYNVKRFRICFRIYYM